ncbi:DUF4174 domain-containing protein [Psychroflexus aestuariivivens]|uniref:DUF4174 domain-containing protein n=1 Tax=Psychroflexus aestuariivivens TaxID=1795040 RepID=UPI000FD6C8AA|nr:DUF4174 domain-containing protein [Psychroflexus aestuariivivens]
MKITLCTILLTLVYTNQDFNDHRIILIHADNEHEEKMNQQVEKFLQEKLKLKDRKLAIFTFHNNELKNVFNTDSESEKFINEFISNHNFEDENFSVRLFGLDGGEKSKFFKIVKPEIIYNQIDQMPMRRAELRRENKKD